MPNGNSNSRAERKRVETPAGDPVQSIVRKEIAASRGLELNRASLYGPRYSLGAADSFRPAKAGGACTYVGSRGAV